MSKQNEHLSNTQFNISMCNSIHEFIKPINKFKEQNMKETDNGQKTEIDLFFLEVKTRIQNHVVILSNPN